MVNISEFDWANWSWTARVEFSVSGKTWGLVVVWEALDIVAWTVTPWFPIGPVAPVTFVPDDN